jgi:hypothetical protein
MRMDLLGYMLVGFSFVRTDHGLATRERKSD